MNNRTKLPILLYDSECTLCVRFKQALDRLPGADSITKLSAHEDSIYEEFTQLNKESCLEVLHILDEDEKVYRGGDAITYLISHFPLVSKFAWLIESDMGKKATDFFYSVAGKCRETLLKRCSTCKK